MPDRDRAVFTCRLDADVYDALAALAEETGVSMTRLIENALRLYLGDRERLETLLKKVGFR